MPAPKVVLCHACLDDHQVWIFAYRMEDGRVLYLCDDCGGDAVTGGEAVKLPVDDKPHVHSRPPLSYKQEKEYDRADHELQRRRED